MPILSFFAMREAVKGQAELVAAARPIAADVSFAGDETEKAYRQYVSGWMFSAFGLQATAGRLFTEDAAPEAVCGDLV